MAKDFDSQNDMPQNDNLFPLEVTTTLPEELVDVSETLSSLKVVSFSKVSDTVHGSESFQGSYFSAEIRKKSLYDFIIMAEDPFHRLSCELPLKFEEIDPQDSAVCEFSQIEEDELVNFIEDDESLLKMVLGQFRMSILRNLLIFCTHHKATKLLIQVDEEQREDIAVFEDFAIYVDKVPVKKGKALQLTIPVNPKILAQCDALMTKMIFKSRQTLWENQSSNSAVRNYLKSNPRFSVVG